MEILFGPDPIQLKGAITKANIVEVGGADPKDIVRCDQEWKTEVEWYLQGWVLNSAFFKFLGEWTVTLYLESMGPGTEYKYEVAISVDDYDPAPDDRRDYKATIEVGDHQVVACTYNAVVAITYKGENGVPGPIAGHCVAAPSMVQFYVTQH